jgi:hypothetical protein
MRMIADPLHSWNLVPFKKRRDVYDIPGVARGEDQRLLDQVDPDLSPEEQSFIRHYLGYADTLLRSVPADYQPQEETPLESKVTDVPDPEHKDPTDKAA